MRNSCFAVVLPGTAVCSTGHQYRVGADVYRRPARRREGRKRRHPRRDGHADQRSERASRDAVSNERGLYDFAAVPPGIYTVKAALTGFKTYENKGVRVGTQQFVTLDITLEVGQLQETITVTGEAPLIDTSNASTGGVIDSQQLKTLPSGGRSAFLFAVTVPTVVASGDAQFNRQQDQTNASLLSLGGGTRRGNNYLVDGVPVTDLRNRASANPTIEALEDVNVQVHQLRRRDRPHRRRHVQRRDQVRRQRLARQRLLPDPPAVGRRRTTSSRSCAGQPLPETYFHLGGGGFGGPIIKNRTFFWFAIEGYGSNTTRNGALRFPTSRERRGDFSQTLQRRRHAGGHLRPADRRSPTATAARRSPATSFRRTASTRWRRQDAELHADARRATSATAATTSTRTAEINDRAMMYTGKVDHRFSDKVSLTGFYLYNKTNEPCANYWEPGLNGPNRFADPGDYILKRRVNVLALNNTWLPSNNTVVTLRYGYNEVHRRRHAVDRLRPGAARLRLDVPERASR